MKIGEAARILGVEVHVLRHWDQERVVVADRTPAGHREYSKEHLARLRVLQACQRVGLSLPEIRQVLTRSERGRTEVIKRRLRAIQAQRSELDAAERFLQHVIGCKHDLITRCAECSEYAECTTL